MEQTDKTWFTLVLIGFIEVLVFATYQIYVSLSGQNIIFVKKVSDVEIPENVGLDKVEVLEKLDNNIRIEDSELN